MKPTPGTPIKWCMECNGERDLDHDYCFECGTKLEESLQIDERQIMNEFYEDQKTSEHVLPSEYVSFVWFLEREYPNLVKGSWAIWECGYEGE